MSIVTVPPERLAEVAAEHGTEIHAGHHVDSAWVGDMLYMSGQIGQVPDGMDPHKEGFDAAVKNAMDSIGKILKDNGLDFGHVVKCTVMLDDMADWPRFNTT